MNILISHVSEEALFALLLKDFLESTFLEQCEVDLISKSGDSAVGDKWLVELDAATTAADHLLALCSPKSIRSPWVHFKFGCVWTKGVPITCLCHSGLHKVDLPAHLRTFEGLEVDDDAFMEQLFNHLAKRFGIKRMPRLSYETMKAELRATLVTITPKGRHVDSSTSADYVKDEKIEIRPTAKIAPPPKHSYTAALRSSKPGFQRAEIEASAVAALFDTAEIQEKIEQRLSEKKASTAAKPQTRSKAVEAIKKKVKRGGKNKDTSTKPESIQKRILKLLVEAGDTGYALDDLSDLLGVVGPRLEPYLDVLKDQAYIDISVEVGRPPEYTIAAKGEQYLAESKPT